MIVNTSTKPENNTKKKTALQPEQYTTMLTEAVNSRLYSLMREGKNVTPQLEATITKKVTAMIESEYRILGTRAGHINHAPKPIQDIVAKCKEALVNCSWSTNGEEYTISILAKKVVEPTS